MQRLTQDIQKQRMDAYIKDHGQTTESGNFGIALFTREQGLYSGITKTLVSTEKNQYRYYAFVLDFTNQESFIEGITGKHLVISLGNLKSVFHYGDAFLMDVFTQEEQRMFKGMGNKFGAIGYEVDPDIPRGVYRAITQYPLSEQVFKLIDHPMSLQVSFFETLEKKHKDTGVNNLRKLLGATKSEFKFIQKSGQTTCSAIINYDYGTHSVSVSDMLPTVLQAENFAKLVDKERGYHDASKWANNFAENLIVGHWHDYLPEVISKTFVNLRSLVEYLYGSCYHQQALSVYEATHVLSDYYDNVAGFNNFTKYPRYLKTAHDVAARNARSIENLSDSNGIILNYIKYRKWEGTFGSYVMKLAGDAKDIVEEAAMQNNCVAGYISSVNEGKSLICFLRNKETPNTSWITVEIRLSGGNPTLVQAYKTFNTQLTDDALKALYGWCRFNNIEIAGSFGGGTRADMEDVGALRVTKLRPIPELHENLPDLAEYQEELDKLEQKAEEQKRRGFIVKAA